MYNILICDDERDIVNALAIYLCDGEYNLFKAYSGDEAIDICGRNDIHLVLLDIMMPGTDGISATVKIREKSNVPVILLTAKSEDSDKVLGLNIGADDYITKPFNPAEVQARVRSQLRRYMRLGGGREKESTLSACGIELDDTRKTVTRDGESVSLTPTEFEILKLLMTETGKVFSPKEIYSRVWQDNPIGSENTVAVHIRHLREKLEIDPADPRFLKVIWGQGYKFDRGDRR